MYTHTNSHEHKLTHIHACAHNFVSNEVEYVLYLYPINNLYRIVICDNLKS